MKKLRKILGTLVLIVILVEIILVFSGVLDLLDAVRIVIVVELSLLVFVAFEVYVIVKAVKSARRSGEHLPFAVEESLEEFFPRALARFVRQDFMILRAIVLFFRRLRDSNGGSGFSYSGPLFAMLAVITVVDGLVAIALHFILPGWIRAVALIIGILGFVWLLGFLSSLWSYVHVVYPDQLRLRFSVFQEFHIPKCVIAGATKFSGDPGTDSSAAIVDRRLVMTVSSQANVAIDFHEAIELESLHPKFRGVQVRGVVIYVDDPVKFISELEGSHIGPSGSTGGRHVL